MTPSRERVLLIIPAHDEEDRIGPTLEDYIGEMEHHLAGRYAIVVVLNGCSDGTLEEVRRHAARCSHLKVIDIRERIGKGGAIIQGIRQSPGLDRIAYVDADGATPARELIRLLETSRGEDCVIGSRWMPGSVLHRPQSRLRRLASRVFHGIVQLLFGLGVRDTQCPAKVLSLRAAREVEPHLRIADLAFDVNLLYSLRRKGFGIREVPIEWTDKLGSKVTRTLFRSSLVMFLSVLRLRLYYSPVYRYLQPFRGIERWVYLKLRAPFIPWGDDGEK